MPDDRHNIGFIISLEMLSHESLQKADKSKNIRDSLIKVSKPDTFKYEVIRIIPKSTINRQLNYEKFLD